MNIVTSIIEQVTIYSIYWSVTLTPCTNETYMVIYRIWEWNTQEKRSEDKYFLSLS
jgi:hypothetical protein